MTSPRASMAVAPMAAPSMMAAMSETASPQPAFHEASGSSMNELEQLAIDLQKPGAAARKLTILGSGSAEKTSRTALALARLLARSAKVVLVDLSASSPVVRAASIDDAAPGLTDLMLGEASFGQVISKDRSTPVHLVTAGRAGADRGLLQSPRLTLALDALLQAYDHVVLDAGAADDLPAALLTAGARAIVVPVSAMSADARQSMSDQLRAVGFGNVTMLSQAVPADFGERGPRFVAA